ncbi:nucleotidyltransferase family protein [Caldimonas tepidiphila]|uniref:nucleotidyltransferase family protein n=1 Tax=Caldimonas tepidiphila TaxID=2315841 RepID=UPI000E5B0B50|nr:NTP transferase domain-containing protein [Caldimonas tepidiphila]
MIPSPVVIVLAAGRGVRFEGASHRLAQPWGASTVLATTLAQVSASGLPLVVVTSEALRELVRGIAPTDAVVTLPSGDGRDGAPSVGESIAAGVLARGDAPGWLVLPADMPMVQSRTLQDIARAVGHHPVTYAQRRGLRGHPVAFSSELYSELRTLSGDHGVRRLMARYPANAIEVEDDGVLLDAGRIGMPPPPSLRRLPVAPPPPLLRLYKAAAPPSG